MAQNNTDITLVIVNYKVKEYIANLLNSVQKAKGELNLQIIVVDNNSGDNSVTFLKERFPEVTYISNNENLGFGRANNQGIKIAEGTYTLLINPDTLVSEDTLSEMVKHMKSNPECGAAGCKILNPDGSFARECRRSVPNLKAALFRVFGLDTIFPESKLFGRRYLGWLSENEITSVPVISGSFMFWRTSVLRELGGFDEDFFMYGEDDDLCYRIKNTEYRIDYVPSTSIIHYKGESAKKGDIKHIRVFNKALYQFFKKHYSTQYSLFFRGFIYLAVWIKIMLSVLLNSLNKIRHIIADLLILNLSIIIGFGVRLALKGTNIFEPESLKYLWINALASLLYLIIGSMFGMFRQQEKSIATSLKSLSVTYTGIVFITFFVRDLAYSRLGLIFGFIFGVIIFIGYKLLRANRSGTSIDNRGRIKNQRVIVVGDSSEASEIISKIHSRPDWNYEVIGKVSVNNAKVAGDELGSLSQLRELIKAYNTDQVFFALNSISYKQMLREISNLQNEGIIFKLIPDSMDFILGKSNVEYLESIPLVEVDFSYSKGFNQFLKRALDISVSLPAWLILKIFSWPAEVFSNAHKVKISNLNFYENPENNRWKNRTQYFRYILSGNISLIGSPLFDEEQAQYLSKKGLTGLIQINRGRISSIEDRENYELYYLQNYSIWLDIDILLKTLFNGTSLSDEIGRALK